ncbi:MAG: ABC transporter permease [Roseibium album]|uniref:ABC transporter permease n=1 Tax=Roseibium album TaxID=311410 RepID=UPI000CF0CECE|nr:putative spermidine/putrescine transport system permease protein [Labrenzia sp. EL_142]MBG6162647.1 putative spermidine/putrescine transport system permease protein [Labrenzia sp. EL_195]MBG6177837.1 putative spermidine/putrescine transport system permease protein [Labrenzia sp. EL_132]MBG6207748.1 putative spermidine/putrescine transport system permease protein [Labrenzia sp. EL_126]MBG6232429.1 putative spermidine/putrescine transport system permease protein [Labrenzia sp. EL_208]
MTWKKWLLVLSLLTPGIGLIVAFIGVAVYIAAAQSFGYYNLAGESSFSLEFWDRMLGRKVFSRAVMYSIYIGVISAFLSVAFAYPLAIWLRKPFPGSLAIGAMLKAPLLVHGLVAAFLFINVISYHGILNQLLQGIGLWDEPHRLQNDRNAIGVLILQTWKNMPFALLLLTGAVQSISDDVLNAARDLGAGSFDRFRKVIAPLTVSAMQAALIIIFIGALADFSFQVIAGPTNRQSLSQLMVFFKDGGRWNDAAVVGVSLMIIAIAGSALLAAVSRIVMRGRIA